MSGECVVQYTWSPRKLDDTTQKRFDIVVSEPVLEEYKEILLRPHIQAIHNYTKIQVEIRVIQMFHKLAVVVEHKVSVNVIQEDPDDNLFIECALAGGAEYIISGDPHLLNQKQYYGVQIFTPRQFIALLK